MLYKWFDYLRHRARLRQWHSGHASGRRGEDLAHRYLRASGYVIVARNWRTRSTLSELDIVARKGETLVFVEVKTRETDEFGTPDQAVDLEKRKHILRAAGEYLRRAGLNWESARFDIVSVLFGDKPSITHIEDAFSRPGPL